MLQYIDTILGFALVMSVVSLLITIVTQIVSSLFGLRGRSLGNALVALFQNLDPNIDKELAGLAQRLADRVLTDPAISDSLLPTTGKGGTLWRRATAIRPIELLNILEQLAQPSTVPSANSAKPAPTTNAQGDEKDGKFMQEAAIRLLKILRQPSSNTQKAMDALTLELPKLAGERGLAIIQEYETAMNVALGNLTQSFNSAQDRARQWFAMHTRIVTIIASIVAALALQLDAFELLRRISSDPDLRARLVANVPAIQKQAEEVFQAAGAATPQLQAQVLSDLDQRFVGMSNVLAGKLPANMTADPLPWLKVQLASTSYSNDLPAVAQAFSDAVSTASSEAVQQWARRFGTIQEQFSTTGIQLIPSPYPKLKDWFWPLRHLLGLLASAALLSLGAPFWFNALKTITSLRPLLADQVDRSSNAPKAQ
jgi:hypothetical protein